MTEFKLSYTAKEIDEKLGKVGQPVSYNDLADKPFGEGTPTPITLDGVVGDKTNVEIEEGVFLVLVSDRVLSAEDVIGGVLNYSDGESVLIDTDMVEIMEGGIRVGNGEMVSMSNIDMTGAPAVGTYFVHYGDGYLQSLTFPSQVKPLDAKYVSMKTLYTDDYNLYHDFKCANGVTRTDLLNIWNEYTQVKIRYANVNNICEIMMCGIADYGEGSHADCYAAGNTTFFTIEQQPSQPS